MFESGKHLMALMVVLLTTWTSGGNTAKLSAWQVTKYCRASSELNGHGHGYTFYDSYNDLNQVNFDNTIDSVSITGMWIMYEHPNYNMYGSGKVMWAYGIDYSHNLSPQDVNTVSSLRMVGQQGCLNCESWTIFDGKDFTGSAMFHNSDAASLQPLDNKASSIIITGYSVWTLYEGPNYTGRSICVGPNMKSEKNGMVLSLGVYRELGWMDKQIESIHRGCWSRRMLPTQTLRSEGTSDKGAWGWF